MTTTKGINQDAFSGDTPPAQKSLIPPQMLPQQSASLNPMQEIIGLTAEQATFRLQQQELVLKQQELNQRFLFRMLTAAGSIAAVVLLGALAIFQLSPGNRANAYAKVAERTAEAIGRPEIKIDCGFRLAGECDAGEMAQVAAVAHQQDTAPAFRIDIPQPVQPEPKAKPVARGAIAIAADPRQTQDYRTAHNTIHQWSQQGHSVDVIAGHYYWLSGAQENTRDPEHAKAKQEPDHKAFKLALQDYYQLSF